MKQLDRLLLKSYIGPLVLTFFITLFVFDMQFLWKYVDDMIGKGLENKTLLELMFYASATMVPMALPLAVLLASIMTFGGFGEHFELTAIKSSGVSLFRFMRPLIIFSIALALLAFYFSNNVLPVANLKFRTLLYDIRHQKPALDFAPGFFNHAIDGFSIRIDGKTDDSQTVYGVMIYDHTNGSDNKHIIVADSAKFLNENDGKVLAVVMYNGYDYTEEATLQATTVNEDMHYRTHFKQWEKRFDLSNFQLQNSDEDFFSKMHSMLNIKQLFTDLDTVNMKIEQEKANLEKNLANYYISVKEKLDTTKMFEADTVIVRNADMVYRKMSNAEKKNVYANALNASRNLKNSLMSKSEVIQAKNRDKDKYWVEIHRKFTLSVACIVLFFIGAPLGSIVKKGGLGWPMVMAVLFFVLYHLFTIVGEKSAVSNVIYVWFGMWLSTIILLPVGVFLTIKAKNDSPLFDGIQLKKGFKITKKD